MRPTRPAASHPRPPAPNWPAWRQPPRCEQSRPISAHRHD
ncbi:EspF repeat-containing protein [Paractinoplanes abujensis]